MNRKPLSDVYSELIERGLSDAVAGEALTSGISTGALRIWPARAYDRQYGPSWVTNPILDFRSGTIAMPLPPVPGSWGELQPRLTAVQVDVDRDQIDQLRPAADSGSQESFGAPNKEAALKAASIAWIKGLPATPAPKKAAAKADALKAIEGLSGRQFDSAWDDAAPGPWKAPGPKT